MAKKLKKYKVGLDSETYAISLVESPAIEETLIALAEQKPIKVQLANEEKHMVYSAVLVPDKPIYRRNENGDEYYLEFSRESIEKMSQDFMKEYRQWEVKTDHDKVADEVCIVESWVKSDLWKDKSVAIGLNENLPIGTWFCGMKVNNIETWDRIKNNELKGFSVESMIHLEEFSKQNNDNMELNVDEMSFWTKMKEVLKETFGKADEENKVEPIEPVAAEDLEAQEPTEPQPTEAPKIEEPVVEEPKPQEEPKPTEAPEEPKNEPKVEAPKEEPNHLEELINNLKEEISALKEMNTGLQNKIKDLGKQPSTKPVNTNAKPSAGDTYSAWREQMRQML